MAQKRSQPTGVRTHQLQRSMRKLTIGVVRSVEKARQEASALGLAEYEQQRQIPISGVAGSEFAEGETNILFDQEFTVSVGDRDSDLEEPQITTGYTIESDEPVIVAIALKDWKQNDRDGYIGATIGIGVYTPNGGEVGYRGRVSLTFQGWSAANLNLDSNA